MTYEFTAVAVPFVLSLVVLGVLLHQVWAFRTERIGQGLLVWAAAGAVLCVIAIFLVSARDPAHEQFWYDLRVTVVPFATFGAVLYAAAYTDRTHWFRPRYLLAAAVVPVLTAVFLWTGPFYDLVWASVETVDGEPLVTDRSPGAWFLFHTVYLLALAFISMYWFVLEFLRHRQSALYRAQTLLLIGAFAVALGSIVATNVGLTRLDWFPVGNAVAAVLISVAVFRYRFAAITPIARDTVVENVETGLIVIDTEKRIIDANQQAAAILSAELDSLIGQRLDSALDSFPAVLEAVSTDDESTSTVSSTASGEQRYYDVTTSNIGEAGNARMGRAILFADVTERIERQTQLEAQKQLLEEQKATLEQQKATLQRQNDRLDKFSSVVSHDLRNPLGIAEMYVDFAEQSGDPEDFEAVREAHDRMQVMIDELLTMARADSIVTDTGSLAVRSLATDTWESVQTDGATLEIACDDELTVDGDWELLRHVFENLYRNSVEHNEPPVTIRVGQLDSAAGIYIEDDGVGIPAVDCEEIFDHGYTTSDDGTGFGLSIVSEFVEAHGWSISVTEGCDGGARFELRTDPADAV